MTREIDGKLVLETSKGSEYYLAENGFWTRKRYSGEVYPRFVYIGSIDPHRSDIYFGPDLVRDNKELKKQMRTGKFYGFTPNFVVGNMPFGIKRDFIPLEVGGSGQSIKIPIDNYDPEKVYSKVSENRIDLSLFSGVSFSSHLGDPINWVSPDLPMLLRKFKE